MNNPAVVQRKKRCGYCPGCIATDCGVCVYCKDMRTFGGTGCKKKNHKKAMPTHFGNGKSI